MKRQITFTLIVLALAALLIGSLNFTNAGRTWRASFVPAAHAQEQDALTAPTRFEFPRRPTCSMGSIQGSYGYIAQGTILPGAPLPPGIPTGAYATQGLVTFDGFGNLTTLTNDSFNGLLVPTTPYVGKYTVNDNCTGGVAITGGVPFNFTIVEGGKEILFMIAAPGAAITGVAKKL